MLGLNGILIRVGKRVVHAKANKAVVYALACVALSVFGLSVSLIGLALTTNSLNYNGVLTGGALIAFLGFIAAVNVALNVKEQD